MMFVATIQMIMHYLGWIGVIFGIVALLFGNTKRGLELLIGGIVIIVLKYTLGFIFLVVSNRTINSKNKANKTKSQKSDQIKSEDLKDTLVLKHSIKKFERLLANGSLTTSQINSAKNFYDRVDEKYTSGDAIDKYPELYFYLYELSALIALSQNKDKDSASKLHIASAIKKANNNKYEFSSRAAINWEHSLTKSE